MAGEMTIAELMKELEEREAMDGVLAAAAAYKAAVARHRQAEGDCDRAEKTRDAARYEAQESERHFRRLVLKYAEPA